MTEITINRIGYEPKESKRRTLADVPCGEWYLDLDDPGYAIKRDSSGRVIYMDLDSGNIFTSSSTPQNVPIDRRIKSLHITYELGEEQS